MLLYTNKLNWIVQSYLQLPIIDLKLDSELKIISICLYNSSYIVVNNESFFNNSAHIRHNLCLCVGERASGWLDKCHLFLILRSEKRIISIVWMRLQQSTMTADNRLHVEISTANKFLHRHPSSIPFMHVLQHKNELEA